MTTEDDFQKALDRCPEDRQCRLVFADFLDERDDPRAEGYRAIAALPKPNCKTTNGDKVPFIWMADSYRIPGSLYAGLPGDWFGQLEGVSRYHDGSRAPAGYRWKNYDTRGDAENAAAFAFAKLPPERRAELLATEPVGAGT